MVPSRLEISLLRICQFRSASSLRLNTRKALFFIKACLHPRWRMSHDPWTASFEARTDAYEE